VAKVLGVIGCGKMAYAILKGLTDSLSANFSGIYINDINSERVSLFEKEFQVKYLNQDELVKISDIIILAVKPQQVTEVMAQTKDLWESNKLLISIAAGIKTTVLEQRAGNQLPVIRVMPNTPCLVGDGVSAVTGGTYASEAEIEMVREMFGQLGVSVTVEEKQLDAVTALSGSGPAYIFLVAESMINAGVLVGLDINLTRKLVLNTIKGSISMLENSGEHPAVLRDQVCSPGGTTIAGVRQLEDNGIRRAFFNAVYDAYNRSIELGKD
jgi:pyrroline-5-carboxylate reductase